MSTATEDPQPKCSCLSARPDVDYYLHGLTCPDCSARLVPCLNPVHHWRGNGWSHCFGDDGPPTKPGCGWHGPRGDATKSSTVSERLNWAQEFDQQPSPRRSLLELAALPERDRRRNDLGGLLALEVTGLKREVAELKALVKSITGLDSAMLAKLVRELQRRDVSPPIKPPPEPKKKKKRKPVVIDCVDTAPSFTGGGDIRKHVEIPPAASSYGASYGDCQSPAVKHCLVCDSRYFADETHECMGRSE